MHDCLLTEYCCTADMRLERASTLAGPRPRWRSVEDRVCCLPAKVGNTVKKCKHALCRLLLCVSVANVLIDQRLLLLTGRILTNSPPEDTWCRRRQRLALIKATMEEMPTCELRVAAGKPSRCCSSFTGYFNFNPAACFLSRCRGSVGTECSWKPADRCVV